MCDQDVFNSDDSTDLDIKLTDNEYKKLIEHAEKDGFRDGIDEGKNKILQVAFDLGYNRIFDATFAVSRLRGIIEVISIESIKKKDKHHFDQLNEIKTRLKQLEEQIETSTLENDERVLNETQDKFELSKQLLEQFIDIKKDCITISTNMQLTHLNDHIQQCQLNSTSSS